MDKEGIKACVDSFIRFVDFEAANSESKVDDLTRLLDGLSYAINFSDYTFDNTDYQDSEREDQFKVRKRIEEMFPEYGYYNVPEKIREDISDSPVIVGDAIDDILDIYQELKEVQWRWDNTSTDDALWYYQNNYRSHWEEHLRNLQVYLHDYRTS